MGLGLPSWEEANNIVQIFHIFHGASSVVVVAVTTNAYQRKSLQFGNAILCLQYVRYYEVIGQGGVDYHFYSAEISDIQRGQSFNHFSIPITLAQDYTEFVGTH